jgi:hypothetical protein
MNYYPNDTHKDDDNQEDLIAFEIEILTKLAKISKEYINLKMDDDNKNNEIFARVKQLLPIVKERISHFCQHQIVEDLIDYDIDKTKKVYYCVKCETSFN